MTVFVVFATVCLFVYIWTLRRTERLYNVLFCFFVQIFVFETSVTPVRAKDVRISNDKSCYDQAIWQTFEFESSHKSRPKKTLLLSASGPMCLLWIPGSYENNIVDRQVQRNGCQHVNSVWSVAAHQCRLVRVQNFRSHIQKFRHCPHQQYQIVDTDEG
jgi:hypothetical protein